jgi:hypothetical protein
MYEVIGRRAVVAWVLLLTAGLLEIVWAYAMKLSEGFTRPRATLITVLASKRCAGRQNLIATGALDTPPFAC